MNLIGYYIRIMDLIDYMNTIDEINKIICQIDIIYYFSSFIYMKQVVLKILLIV